MQSFPAVSDEAGAGERPPLDPLGEPQLPLGEDTGVLSGKVTFEPEGHLRATEAVGQGAGLDRGERQLAEANVALAFAGGAQQPADAGDTDALHEPGRLAAGEASIGDGAAGPHRRHQERHRQQAVAGERGDHLVIAAWMGEGRIRRKI